MPQASYRSAFADYRGWREEKLADWRGVNDLVAAIGGWRVYLREAQQSESGQGEGIKPLAKSAEPAPVPVKPAARGHAGHH